MSSPGRFQRLLNWEHSLVHRLHGIKIHIGVDRVLTAFVRIGDGWGWAAVAGALFFLLPWLRFKALMEQSLLAVAISLPVYWGLKFSLRRKRPFHFMNGISPKVPALDKYSFPSGHTMNNLAVAMTLALNFPSLWPFALAIPLSLGLLRIFYGVHFLTDIVAGALLGAMSSLVAHWLFPRLFS